MMRRAEVVTEPTLREETGLESSSATIVYDTINRFQESRLVFRTRFEKRVSGHRYGFRIRSVSRSPSSRIHPSRRP